MITKSRKASLQNPGGKKNSPEKKYINAEQKTEHKRQNYNNLPEK